MLLVFGGNLNPGTTSYLWISASRMPVGVIHCQEVRRDGAVCMGRGRRQPEVQFPTSFVKMEDEFTGYWIYLYVRENEGEKMSTDHEFVQAASGSSECIGLRDCISLLGLPYQNTTN